MLNHYIENLEKSIQWVQCHNDFDVLCLAKERMDQLIKFVSTLSKEDQHKAYSDVESVLPMEWPLWMEACRYDDRELCTTQELVFH